jgi:predicted dehydrogenase
MRKSLPVHNSLTRRRFLYYTALAAGGSALTGSVVARPQPRRVSPNEKLNLAIIGVGGRGGADIAQVSSENIVALCDVNENHLDSAAAKRPNARKYVDFRQLYDQSKDIDAVVVATTEHSHAFAVLPAIKLGKHVYCEKPLAHNVWEARLLAEEAAKAKIATQMGTQMHAQDNFRRVVELIQSGAIGPVKETHVWVSRAWGDGDRPAEKAPVPDYFHWDLWLGPAPQRPFHPSYISGQPKWYKYWDFGGGTLPDLGSHWNDMPFWALKLRHPLTIEAHGPKVSPETAPASYHITYEYGARGDMPPVKLTWYQGTDKPPLYTDKSIPQWENGVLFVGVNGMLLANYNKHLLLPEEKFADFKRPEPFVPNSIGHWKEWIDACKTGKPTTCNFDYSGALTEANQLGNVAYRTGMKIQWDPVNLKVKNCADAAHYIRTDYHNGWKLV